MDVEYKFLLNILKSFLHKKSPEVVENVDWMNLIHLAQIHNVAGILGYMSMSHPICPDEGVKSMLRKNCLVTMAIYSQRAQLAKDLFAIFADNDIRFCPMKGIEVRRLYPVPELRSFSDVDFLIYPEDRDKAHKLMKELGFEVKNDWEPVYSYLKDTEFYEIHTQLVEVDISEKADYLGYFAKAWEHTKEVSPCRYRFTREFHFVYLITHIAKHVQGSGAGVRMYLDIAAYILRYGTDVDWAWIFRELKNLHLYDFTCSVLSCVESWFDVTCPEPFEHISKTTLDNFQKYTLEAGVFGKYQRETGLASLKKQSGSRLSVLMKRAFPKADQIEARYTYLQDKPYLLPVAWVHRFFKTDISLKDHAKEAKTILTADQTQVQRLKDICKDIGL